LFLRLSLIIAFRLSILYQRYDDYKESVIFFSLIVMSLIMFVTISNY